MAIIIATTTLTHSLALGSLSRVLPDGPHKHQGAPKSMLVDRSDERACVEIQVSELDNALLWLLACDAIYNNICVVGGCLDRKLVTYLVQKAYFLAIFLESWAPKTKD